MTTATNCQLCTEMVLLGTKEAFGFSHKSCAEKAVNFVAWFEMQHRRYYRQWFSRYSNAMQTFTCNSSR
mgnify:CR=1 FL=1